MQYKNITYPSSLQLVVPRHTLDISMKYSYVPQTDNTPYKLDRTSPEIDWTVSEPEKVTVQAVFEFELGSCFYSLHTDHN